MSSTQIGRTISSQYHDSIQLSQHPITLASPKMGKHTHILPKCRPSFIIYYSLFIILCLVGTVQLSAQTAQNKEIYETTIDYLNCNLIQFLLEQDPANQNYADEFGNAFNCSKATNPALIQRFLDNRNLKAHARLSIAINDYKTEFSNQASREELINILENDLLDTRIETFTAPYLDAYNDLRDQLAPEIEDRFANFVQPEGANITSFDDISEQLPLPTPAADTTQTQVITADDASKSSGNLRFVFGLIIGIVLSGLAWFLLFVRKQRTNEPKPPPSYAELTMEERIRNLQKQVNDLHATIGRLENENEALQKANQALREENTELKQQLQLPIDSPADQPNDPTLIVDAILENTTDDNPTPVVLDPQEIQPVITEPVTPKRAIFYMRTPHRDGYFKDGSKATLFVPTESVYLFEVTDNEDIARFSIVEDPETMLRAIQTYSRYIEPVCDSDELYNSKATRVITEVSGTAIRRGDRWEVTEKAIIRYV